MGMLQQDIPCGGADYEKGNLQTSEAKIGTFGIP